MMRVGEMMWIRGLPFVGVFPAERRRRVATAENDDDRHRSYHKTHAGATTMRLFHPSPQAFLRPVS